MKIKKVVIPAAGFGTRFLPQTKAMPKEMLPIVDKPVIQYVVEEAVESGIEDVIIVTGYSKRPIEDHFDTPSADLVNNLINGKKEKILEQLRKISEMANFIYIRQKGPYGNGTPVLTAEPIVGNEMFAVMFGDDFIYSNPPRLAQMIAVYEKYHGAVMSTIKVKHDDLKRYGVPQVKHIKDNVYKIEKIVEKPLPENAPSDMAAVSSYILPPEIFPILKNQKPGTGGEIYLPEAIDQLIKTGYPVYACEIQNGKYYDTGNKLEYLKTLIEFALDHNEVGPEFKKYLRQLDLK